MIAHVEGLVSEKNADSLVLDVGGVGFLIGASAATLSAAPAAGETFRVFTIMNVREDAMELVGFATREEKRMYERLRSVSGVGSKMALQILSGMNVHDLSVAVVTGDSNALTRIPGVGKKIAQRLVLELRDKVGQSDIAAVPGGPVPQPAAGGQAAEAVAALQGLGFTSQEAERAVSRVAAQAKDLEEMIRLALKSPK